MTVDHSALNAATRAAAISQLRSSAFDLIVVGGGITGVGVALDAASRGLRTALVEQDDLASGTSRWSSKLAHGGLRYLATGHVGIAAQSARERHLLLTVTAPHLARPRRNLIPLTPDLPSGKALITAAGPLGADALRRWSGTPAALLPGPRFMSRKEIQRALPAWDPASLRGAMSYWDGQLEDDARLVVTVARTAAAHGALIATYLRAEQVSEREVALHDQRSGDRFIARAAVVVNATGVWADGLDSRVRLAPSRGSHLVLPAQRLGHPDSVVNLTLPGHFGRYVFAMPESDGLVYLGLTDEPAPGVDGHAPQVPHADEDHLLSVLSRHLRTPLDRTDVAGRFAGLRPLVLTGQDDRATSDISREHLLLDAAGEPLTIVGGKLTTYRRMAQDTVDAATRRLGIHRPCLTDRLPLVGAAPPSALARVRAPRRLVRRYGTLAPQLLAMIEQDRSLGEPVAAGSDTQRVELLYGLMYEGALTCADLVERRTRITMRDAMRDESAAVADELIGQLVDR